jgi:lactate racemase
MAAECADGLPSGGAFERLLATARDPEDLLKGAGDNSAPAEADGWQTQVLGRVLSRARVWLRADGLSDHAVRVAQLRPVEDIDSAVADALGDHGDGSRLCVLVRGPLAVATDTSGGGGV